MWRLFVIVLACTKCNATTNTYSAVVVEYSPIDNSELRPCERVLENVNTYLEILAKVSVLRPDIVVFPEYGLHYKAGNMTRQYLLEASTTVPSNVELSKGFLWTLSRAARKHRTYLVVNLMERAKCSGGKCATDGFNLYNTNVVFDREGALIARYRKYNLYHEYFTNVTERPEVVTFETDFGVTFGTFTCFDILHAHPTNDLLAAGVRHFAYPTLWFSKLVFLTSVQVQQMWAYGNNVALLASNVNYPALGNGGSGIHPGRHAHTSYIGGRRRTKILHSFISKTLNGTGIVREGPADMSDYNFLKESYEEYQTTPIKVPGKQTICHDENCCLTIVAEAETEPRYSYRLVSYSGWKMVKPFDNRPFEVCALIACRDNCLKSCGERLLEDSPSVRFKKVSVEMTSMTVSNVLPNTLTMQYLPLQPHSYNYQQLIVDNVTVHKKLYAEHPIDNIMVFGLYSVAPSMDELSNFVNPE